MRVVFWGGPWDDRAVDIPDPLPATWLVAAEYAYGDRAPVGDPLLSAILGNTRPPPYVYRMIRCAAADRDGPPALRLIPPIARHRLSAPTWPVYVPAAATEDDLRRFHARAHRPVVTGPVEPLRVLVDRHDRYTLRIGAAARIAARGPLP